jgi:hypothetical protein
LLVGGGVNDAVVGMVVVVMVVEESRVRAGV